MGKGSSPGFQVMSSKMVIYPCSVRWVSFFGWDALENKLVVDALTNEASSRLREGPFRDVRDDCFRPRWKLFPPSYFRHYICELGEAAWEWADGLKKGLLAFGENTQFPSSSTFLSLAWCAVGSPHYALEVEGDTNWRNRTEGDHCG